MRNWLNLNKSTAQKINDEPLGYLGLLNRSYDLMQDQICLMSIELHKPEVVVNIPRSIASTLELYRADDMIEEGRRSAKKALDEQLKRMNMS
jgi:predicted acylesterase/phospholipase RssA